MREWPPAPPSVVPEDELPAQPDPRRVKVLHVITRFGGGSGGNMLRARVLSIFDPATMCGMLEAEYCGALASSNGALRRAPRSVSVTTRPGHGNP